MSGRARAVMCLGAMAACGGSRVARNEPAVATAASVDASVLPDTNVVADIDAAAPAMHTSAIDDKRVAMLAMLDRAIGPRPASLGELFGNLTLGTRLTPALRATLEKLMNENALMPMTDDSGGVINGVTLSLLVEEKRGADATTQSNECVVMREKLATAWGAPTIDDTWLDSKTHQRAQLDATCTLEITRYLEPADWVAALPIGYIGKNARQLEAAHPPDGDVHMDLGAYYSFAGVGRGHERTDVAASVEGTCGPRGGRCNTSRTITALHVTTTTDAGSAAAIRDALDRRLHAKATKTSGEDDEPSVEWAWRTRPPVSVRYDGDGGELELAVGISQ